MEKRQSDESNRPIVSAAGSESHPEHGAKHKDHFLQLMFFQGGRETEPIPGVPHPARAAGSYAPLRHSTATAGVEYALPSPGSTAAVRLDSPAIDVMTDLRRVSAVTIEAGQSIVEANHLMIARGVRALFVVDGARRMLGLMTATDVLGERPIQFAQARGVRYDEVTVRDIMTPAERLEVLAFDDVSQARVGDIVATLKLAGRQHALAVETAAGAPSQRTARGIFSLTQIARQLGIAPAQVHDIARTFAEIEAAIAS